MASRKGKPNKSKVEFRAALRKYCEDRHAHPHYWLADLLTRKGVRIELKLQAARELCRYIEPQLKSVDMQGSLETPGMTGSIQDLLAWFQGLSDMQLRNLRRELAMGNGHEHELG